MGIPKYFRFISERWPNISQLVNDNVIPEFDNLYLDMNSILHTATHKDDDPSHRLTEMQMFLDIFNYIEHLFTVIKPKKVFYMAIDGVAPRAKMNQQRARRFRSALDAETRMRKAMEDEVELPPTEAFDSNAITPGTEFMAKLTVYLRYFISRKMSEDKDWQNTRVILSGHEVPGEGEHKIMSFIRSLRAEDGYPANTRHCLYGLDADLIMLGLSTHEPHFALLREEVVFGRRSGGQSQELTEKRFFLLHLSLTREYLQLEFDQLLDVDSDGSSSEGGDGSGDSADKDGESTSPRPSANEFDFERMLDDFILINFFVGNDFLPELPMLLIGDGALPLILKTYSEYLVAEKKYLSKDGIIDFQQLKEWIQLVSRYQLEKFDESAQSAKWYDNQIASLDGGPNSEYQEFTIDPEQKSLVKLVKPFILNAVGAENPREYALELPKTTSVTGVRFLGLLGQQTGMRLVNETNEAGETTVELILDLKSFPAEADEEGRSKWLTEARKVIRVYERAKVASREDEKRLADLYAAKYVEWRDQYYKSKFGQTHNSDAVNEVVHNYLEGLQWVLLYYYRGCPSWSWYFKDHYAPMTPELLNGITPDFKANFDLSHPFRPFQQLMGVLPDRSAKLVPPAYRDLMTDPASPIIDFYPHDFELDKNGKRADWEAVVLIPFIDEKRLLAALETKDSQLTDEERARNSYGTDLQFKFDPQSSFFYPSPLEALPSIPDCHCKIIEIHPHDLEPSKMVFGKIKGTSSGVSALAGFPSLDTLDYEFEIKQTDVKVFEMPSRNESVILTMKNAYENDSGSELAHRLLGSSVYVDYPFLREVKVVGISNQDSTFELSNGKVQSVPLTERDAQDLRKKIQNITVTYSMRRGIDIGPTNTVLHVQRMLGLMRKRDGSYQKEFSSNEDELDFYPVQLLVEDVESEDARFMEREALPIEEEYPAGSQGLLLVARDFGSPTTVMGHADNSLSVDFLRLDEQEPRFGNDIALLESRNIKYFASRDAAKMLNIDQMLFSKMTSRFLFRFGHAKFDLGLVLKKAAQNEKVLGLSRKGFRSWEYSESALKLVNEYYTEYSQVLRKLGAISAKAKDGIPDLATTFDAGDAAVKANLEQILTKMKKWLQEKTADFSFVDVSDEAFSNHGIEQVEKWATEYSSKKHPSTKVTIKNLPRSAIITSETAPHHLRRQKFFLGNRVISALDFGKVPLYSKGTVVGIHSGTVKTTLDVVFDNEFDAGSSLDKRVKSKRGLIVDAASVLNLTFKQASFDRAQDKDVFKHAVSLRSGEKGRDSHDSRGSSRNTKGFGQPSGDKTSRLKPADVVPGAWGRKKGGPAPVPASAPAPAPAPARAPQIPVLQRAPPPGIPTAPGPAPVTSSQRPAVPPQAPLSGPGTVAVEDSAKLMEMLHIGGKPAADPEPKAKDTAPKSKSPRKKAEKSEKAAPKPPKTPKTVKKAPAQPQAENQKNSEPSPVSLPVAPAAAAAPQGRTGVAQALLGKFGQVPPPSEAGAPPQADNKNPEASAQLLSLLRK